ncbi:MAG: hypothetical protein JW864_13105 [Spirochaetes bacterium]|nr:hypothetical protein [Spirochaetota bacterium]
MSVILEKLLSYNGNKYIFSKAAMEAIDKIGNLKEYREDMDTEGKIVVKILNFLLEEKIKFQYLKDMEEEKK